MSNVTATKASSISHGYLIHLGSHFSGLLNSALQRSDYGKGYVFEIESSYNGVPNTWKMTMNFGNPGELILFDQLIMPKVRKIFRLASEKGIKPEVKQVFTPQGLYASDLGTVQLYDFNNITALLERQKQETVVSLPFGNPEYA